MRLCQIFVENINQGLISSCHDEFTAVQELQKMFCSDNKKFVLSFAVLLFIDKLS